MPKTNRTAESIKVGSVYGYWEVLGTSYKTDYLHCRCTCGKLKSVNVYSLINEKSLSCGCKSAEISRETRENRNR